MRRLLAIAAAVLLGVSGAVVSAAPAQAWSYCDPPPSYTSYLNGYNSQGYCGAWEILGHVPATCINLSSGSIPNNWMGSVWNRTLWTVTLFSQPNCDYINGPYKYIAPNTSDPDLYPDYLFRTVSSVRWTTT
jgi:hypothetical protein